MHSLSLQRFSWCIVAVILLTIGAAAPASEPDLSPQVRELRDALHVPIAANVPEPVALQTRRQAISDIAARLCRLTDLRDALLLETWRDGDADTAVASIDGALRTGISATLQSMV